MPTRRTATALAVSALASASVVLAAPSASADLVTYCVGNGGAVTLPTDLFVPDGKSCSLKGTTVTGNVQVAPGANLVVDGGTINGQVQVAGDGYFDASNTRVDGGVTLASGGFGIYYKNTHSGTITVQAKGEATTDSFLFVDGSTVDGSVQANAGEVRLDKGTQVSGNVSTTNAYYTDVTDSFVDGTLSVLNNATGSVVCGGAVQGKATFAGNLVGVQLGPNGALDTCASGGYFGRDVSISNTSGKASLDDTIINGQLQLSGNNPAAVVAANNRIRGGIVGDHTAPLAAKARAQATTPRNDTKEQGAEARLAKAVTDANAAGDAHLMG
jgi:cytoskeletal protein CcmA (bactofilin family)